MRAFPLLCGRVTLSAAVAALGACGGDLVLPDDNTVDPRSLDIVPADGDAQHGTVGQVLPAPLVVRVTDSAGQPVGGQRVAFVLSADAAPAEVIPDTTVTDADGRASSRWVLGPVAGEQAVEARLVGTERKVVQFVAQADAGVPAVIGAVSGQNQRGFFGQTLEDSLVVLVADRFGNPVPDVSVRWDVVGGQGQVSAPAVTTGADGRSAVEWTLGFSLTQQRVEASVGARVDGSPVIFTAEIGR